MTGCVRLSTVLSVAARNHFRSNQVRISAAKMSISPSQSTKIIDSHLHVWASPQEVILYQRFHLSDFRFLLIKSRSSSFFFFLKAANEFPYFPGQEPTLPGHVDFLLQVCHLFFTYSVYFCRNPYSTPLSQNYSRLL